MVYKLTAKFQNYSTNVRGHLSLTVSTIAAREPTF